MKSTRRQTKIQIGIVSAPMPKYHLHRAESYLDKAYISWIEMSGANAVVIPYNTESLLSYLKTVQGIVWVGGAIENTKTHTTRQYEIMIAAFRTIFDYAIRENDRGNYFPLWGTCLGFDILAMMGENIQDGFFKRIQHATKFSLSPLKFEGASRIRSYLPKKLMAKISSEPVVRHLHEYGFDVDVAHTKKIKRYLNVVSTDLSNDGVRFVNMFEYKKYPFYGSQWHPEKPLTDLGVELSHTLSLFFKKECSKNKSILPNWTTVSKSGTLKSKYSVLLKGGK
jgi:gamma-glutamyl hydrolase